RRSSGSGGTRSGLTSRIRTLAFPFGYTASTGCRAETYCAFLKVCLAGNPQLAWCRRALSRYAFDPHDALVARDLPAKLPPVRDPDRNPHRRRVLAAAKPGPTRAQGQSYLPTHYWFQPQFAPTLVDETNWSSRIIEDLEVVFHGRRLAALHRGVRICPLF